MARPAVTNGTPPLEFAVLGEIEVRLGGKRLSLEGERARALLAFMLVRANRALSADELIEAVWGDRHLRDAHNTLQACVSRLRTTIGSEALQTTTNGYRLALAPDQLDSHRFEELVAEGGAALSADDAGKAAVAFTAALGLWRGKAYADVAYAGVADDEIERLEELRLAATESRLDALLRLGEAPELVAELSGLVKAHPLRERLRSQLAVALYRSGRQADALDACRAARQMLRDELGLEPTPELREIELAILRQDASLDRSHVARPPVPMSSLVGREEQVAEALALLRRDDVRLLTITGPGGIGKTRLALALASELADPVFVDLSTVVDTSFVASAIAAALGLRQWRGQSVVEALEQHLRDRETLLLLDSFEHVLDEAPLTARLLAAAPRLTLLVTSRAVLRVSPEHEFPLGPLDATEAVDLFRARAAAVDPGYAVAPEEEHALAEICQRLDGLPLAIELAAARANLLSPRALLHELASGFDVLSAGYRDAPVRHRTLRATIDWSWALLAEDERRAFQRLGLFVGGFTVEAADAVIGEGRSLPRLASLADKSLIRREREDRFSLLDTVRDYTRERLAEQRGDYFEAQLRHAEYFADLAEAADRELLGPRESEALHRLELEHGNTRAALAFAIEAGQRELAVRLALASRRFWHWYGHLAEGLASLRAALAVSLGTEPDPRCRMLNGAGILAAEQGDYEAAQLLFEELLALARAAGVQEMVAQALGNIAVLALHEGNLARAEDLLEEALQTAPDSDYFAAVSFEELAALAAARQDLDRAKGLAEDACALAQRIGSPRMLGNARLMLGTVLLERRELGEAASVLREALALKLEIAERSGLGDCLEVLGELAAAQGEGKAAALLFGAAARIRSSVGAARTANLQGAYARYTDLARREAGARAFDDAFDEGGRLPLTDVLALALGSEWHGAQLAEGAAP